MDVIIMKRIKKKRKLNKKEKYIIFSILILIIIITITLFFFKSNNKDTKKLEKKEINITLISNLTVEINSKVNLLSFIEDIENGKIITEDTEIDTSVLGNKTLEILITDNYNQEEKYSFEIQIIDTTKPTIEGVKEITTYVGKNINLLENIKASDNSLENITVEIKGTYDFNKAGEYPLNYIATDSSGNETISNFTLKVLNDPNNYTFTTSKGYNAKVINGVTYIDGILIVNKTYSLPSNYGNGLTTETQNAFNKMKADATSLGLNIYISSGYRSYYDQKYIYNNYVAIDGKTNADTYSARAGHSEHQTGLAFDLNSIDNSFTYTDEGKWVHDNCYRYGLIIRYPKGKESITGYMHESWHLRYVGESLATKLYNNGNWITLEEYFGINSQYNY